MKKLLFILPLLAACSTENTTTTTNGMCNCYKETQQQNQDGTFSTTSSSAPSPDACQKDGLIEYSNSRTYRVLWHCN